MWFVAALWLALVAVLAANWLRISTALSEIVVGTVAQLVIGALVGRNALGAKAEWITFLQGLLRLRFAPTDAHAQGRSADAAPSDPHRIHRDGGERRRNPAHAL
jgi:hypothetical protein